MAAVFLLTRDGALAKAVSGALPAGGQALKVVDSAADLAPALEKTGTASLLVDLVLGQEALRALRAVVGRTSRVSVIAVGDPGRPATAFEAFRIGALDILARPLRKADLLAALANAREFQGVTFRVPQPDPLGSEDGFFAVSGPMGAVREVVQRVAPSRCRVLLIGERGTGKEMVARAIHRLSRSADRPLVTIDCAYRGESPQSDRAAVADFEKELFDAVARPTLDMARLRAEETGQGLDDGPSDGVASTVYLRGVDQMAPVVQGTLERLLVESESQASDEGQPGVRILAGARPEILNAVERGAFRRDLFDRLAVVQIELPALRRRPQDVPLLATHLLKEACAWHDAPPKVFSPAAQNLLAALPWRGNARELQHLTERLAVLITRGVILLEDVLEHVLLEGTAPRGIPRGTLREARERFEREFIAGVVQRHRGRMGAAAKELGIERTNLYRKMKQLGIKGDQGGP